MTKGQVKWFDPKKGYGFIVGPEGQDVFVHYSHIQSEGFKALKDGEWVEYELIQGEKGWQARDVNQSPEMAARAAERAPGPGPGPAPAPQRPAATPRGYEGADTTEEPEPPVSRGYEGADD